MSLVSYAQNFEDVMLWRALKNVENGFYIDVGANDPTVESVTKLFYERGWHGINIEPLPSHHADLVRERPRDINLQCAAGAGSGEVEVWECDIRGWATASPDVIAQHMANGHSGTFHKVPVYALAELCAQWAPSEIHFLKIDVEGFEKAVINGMDFSRFRPWLLVVEATRPNSIEEMHDEWESIVLSAGYVLAYTDGLNRFYVSKEHAELQNSLRYPPNVFDHFIRSDHRNAELRARQAEGNAKLAEIEVKQAEATALHWQEQAHRWHERILEMHASTSWKVTRPLRAFKRLLSGDASVINRSIAAAKLKFKQTCRPLMVAGIGYLKRRPALRNHLKRVVTKYPALHQRLLRLAVNTGALNSAHLSTSFKRRTLSPELHTMTPRARQIYQDLKASIENKTKEGH